MRWSMFIVSLTVLSAVSAVFGWIPHRADLVLALILPTTCVIDAAWSAFAPCLDRTNDPLVIEVIRFMLRASLTTVTILAPLVTLVAGLDWFWVAVGGGAIALSAMAMSSIKLRYW